MKVNHCFSFIARGANINAQQHRPCTDLSREYFRPISCPSMGLPFCFRTVSLYVLLIRTFESSRQTFLVTAEANETKQLSWVQLWGRTYLPTYAHALLSVSQSINFGKEVYAWQSYSTMHCAMKRRATCSYPASVRSCGACNGILLCIWPSKWEQLPRPSVTLPRMQQYIEMNESCDDGQDD